MHEMSLMNGVFTIIEDVLAKNEVNRVMQVKLKVGQLTNAVPDALVMAFEAFAKDTKVEGAELVIEKVPVRLLCQSCGQEFGVSDLVFSCPNCQQTRIKIIQGEELMLESLEVE